MMIAPPGLRPRHVVIGLLAAVLGIALIVTGVGRLAGFGDVTRTISGGDPQWLIACVGGQVLVFAGYAGVLRRAIAADGGPRVSTRFSVSLALASFAATQLFAFAGIAGLAIVYLALRRLGHDRRQASVVLVGLNTCVYLVFGVIGWTAAAIVVVSGDAPPAMTVPWLIGFPAIVLAARWFTSPVRAERWAEPNHTGARRALGLGVAAARWARARVGRGDWPLLGWGACYWLGDLVSLGAALEAFGGRPPVAVLAAAYTTGYLVQSLPLPFVGSTGVDAATTLLLHTVGVPLEVALVGVVAHRVFAFWLPIAPGSWLAFSLTRSPPLTIDAARGDRAASTELS